MFSGLCLTRYFPGVLNAVELLTEQLQFAPHGKPIEGHMVVIGDDWTHAVSRGIFHFRPWSVPVSNLLGIRDTPMGGEPLLFPDGARHPRTQLAEEIDAVFPQGEETPGTGWDRTNHSRLGRFSHEAIELMMYRHERLTVSSARFSFCCAP
jgi:hypothetical protein